MISRLEIKKTCSVLVGFKEPGGTVPLTIDSNLNGIYHQRGSHASITTGGGVFWSTWKSLSDSILKEGRDENKISNKI